MKLFTVTVALVAAAYGQLDKSFRLPTALVPEDYELQMTFDRENEGGLHSGVVKLQFNAVESTSQLVLHQDGLVINEARLCDFATRACDTGASLQFSTNSRQQSVTFTGAQFAAGGRFLVQVRFGWRVRRGGGAAPGGAFSSSRYHVTTQGQQLGMRKIFPHFDEPALKVTIQATVVVLHSRHRNERYPTYSNTNPIDRIEESGVTTSIFKRTPVMSSYLFIFIIPTQGNINGVMAAGSNPTSTAFGSSFSGRRVAQLTRNSVLFFNDFFGVSEVMEKIDYAIDGGFLAMENWGLIYGVSSSAVVIHEVAHSWFGNMVTTEFWDDVYLNEGFTAYATAVGLSPLGVGSTSRELRSISSSAIRSYRNFARPLKSDGFYGGLNEQLSGNSMIYTKGGAIGRMISEMLGGIEESAPDWQRYVSRFQFGNPDTAGMADAFANGDEAIRQVILDWTTQGGLPRITVRFDSGSNEFVITQRSELSSQPNLRWSIPIFHSIRGSMVRPTPIFPRDQNEFRLPLQSGTSPRDYDFNPDVEAPMNVDAQFFGKMAANKQMQFKYTSEQQVMQEPEPKYMPKYVTFGVPEETE